MVTTDQIIVRHMGMVDYDTAWKAMQDFSLSREADAPDEIWLLEHPAVFTQGRNGKQEHLLHAGKIPLVQSDRGGQITYHGPGQLVMYVLIDISRRQTGIRQLVGQLEQCVIATLLEHGIHAVPRKDAPGVYVDGAKIASLGLRVRRGCSYHGLALNLDMDLSPFTDINPCGYRGMPVTQLRDLTADFDRETVAHQLVSHFCSGMGYLETVTGTDTGSQEWPRPQVATGGRT